VSENSAGTLINVADVTAVPRLLSVVATRAGDLLNLLACHEPSRCRKQL
jgi:hypothetical protein